MDTKAFQIPLFPLSLLLLPGERTALHIFEPRYQELLADVESEVAFFGIPFFNKGQRENDKILGSLVRVVEVVKRYAGGESDIIVEAVDLFELKNYQPKGNGKLYPTGNVELLERYREWPLSKEVLSNYHELLRQLGQLSTPEMKSSNTFQVIRSLNMDHDDRANFLKMAERELQERKLISLLKFSALILEQEKKKEFDFYMN